MERIRTTDAIPRKSTSSGSVPEVASPTFIVIDESAVRASLEKTAHGLRSLFFLKMSDDATERAELRLRLIAILRLVASQRESMQQEMSRMIESMTPPMTVPLPVQVLQARRNAQARMAMLQEFGAVTSAELGELAGSRASNKAALAHRWKADGRIFAVTHQGTTYFPGFQFAPNGQPLDVIAEVLTILEPILGGWELALWFGSANGWLGGKRPVDFLTDAPRVLDAARREAEERVF